MPTNASTSFSSSSRRSAGMSEGKKLLQTFLSDVPLPPDISSCCNLFPHNVSRTKVLSARQALCAVLEKCCVSNKEGLWSQCGVDWGQFSWTSLGEDLSRQRAYVDANLMTLSPLCSLPTPSSDALPHRKRDNFLNFTPFVQPALHVNGAASK